jgi:hypothetical protein
MRACLNARLSLARPPCQIDLCNTQALLDLRGVFEDAHPMIIFVITFERRITFEPV